MLISLGFTAAESVVVSFNQKTQYDSIWQSPRPHLNATVGARDLILLFFLINWSRATVGGSVALLQFSCGFPGLCRGPTLINQFIKCCVDFGVLALVRFGSPPLVADRLTDKWITNDAAGINIYCPVMAAEKRQESLSFPLFQTLQPQNLKLSYSDTTSNGSFLGQSMFIHLHI